MSGVDSHLVDPTVWSQQTEGLSNLEISLPLTGEFPFQKSGQAVICGVKNDAKHPVVVVDASVLIPLFVVAFLKSGLYTVVPYCNHCRSLQGL